MEWAAVYECPFYSDTKHRIWGKIMKGQTGSPHARAYIFTRETNFEHKFLRDDGLQLVMFKLCYSNLTNSHQSREHCPFYPFLKAQETVLCHDDGSSGQPVSGPPGVQTTQLQRPVTKLGCLLDEV